MFILEDKECNYVDFMKVWQERVWNQLIMGVVTLWVWEVDGRGNSRGGLHYVDVRVWSCVTFGWGISHRLPEEEAQYCAILPMGELTVRFYPSNSVAVDSTMGFSNDLCQHVGLKVPTNVEVGPFSHFWQLNLFIYFD